MNLGQPSPVKSREIKWLVVTPETADEVFKKLREENVDVVLFAVTDEGYEQLALTMAEIRNYIAQQKSVIIKYKEYYEPEKPSDTSK